MKKNRFHTIIPAFLVTLISLVTFLTFNPMPLALALQLTVTPTASAEVYIKVITEEPQINVRMGPSSTIYPIVGTMLTGSTAPALGRSPGGDWIQIEFPGAPNNVGWVYSPLVQASPPGMLRIVEPPPTPIPPATSTIDPTLVAQFNIAPTNTRLPTFTPPPTLTVPEYLDTSPTPDSQNSISMAAVIIALVVSGSIGFLLSIFMR